jgi:hypothetical protein
VSSLPVFLSIPSLISVYSLNVWSPTSIALGLLVSLVWDYVLAAQGKAPKYWFAFRFKYLLAAQLFLVVATINLTTFVEYKNEMKKLLGGYQSLVTNENNKELGPAPRVQTQKSSTKSEAKKDILSDPTK